MGRDHSIIGWSPIPELIRMRRPSKSEPGSVGRCISVTPWGNGRIRWVRLRFADGTEKSYAPTHVQALPR